MYRYYLGAFGNRSFIRPQYEIMSDNTLREVGDDRWAEFPNGGTVSLANMYDADTDDIKNKLLKFRIDFNRDLHPTYDSMNDNSNRYQISFNALDDFEKDEIIEIIDIDYTFDDFLNDNTKRTIRIKHKPNKLILLRSGQDCYGPFEFMISAIEDLYGDEAFYTLKIFVSSGEISRYKVNDLENIIMDGNFSIRRNDRMQFIYNMDKLLTIEPVEKIDYIDNEELANFFKSLLDRSDSIENLAELREQFLQLADTFSESANLTDFRVKKICELLQTSVDLSDYKVKLMEEYFRNNPDSVYDKEEYLRTHSELLDDIVREDLQYEVKVKAINDELDTLEIQKAELIAAIDKGKSELQSQRLEMEKLGEQAIEQKKQEIEDLLSGKKKELSDTEVAIDKAKRELNQYQTDQATWRRACDSVKAEYAKASGDLNALIVEWAANNRTTEITKLLVSQLEMPEEDTVSVQPTNDLKVNSDLDADQIVSLVNKKLQDAGRTVSKDEVYNYLISVVQNYITVFAGEPGTGKTSLCKLLAKSLGIYEDRFAEILVERGWTSSRDLIGYYNPLTKEIEDTQPSFSDCMRRLDKENIDDAVEAPFFVLLDEANLSPIEYYWSTFNYFCDDPKNQRVEYSNGTVYKFGAELKFLATINYDQTTTDLSPRFLDRAWVISMNGVSADAIISNMTDDSTVINNEEVVSLEILNKYFSWQFAKEKKMNQITKTRLDTIIDKMREGGHSVSARSLNAIVRYYLVAENYMSSKEVALDFAISQKILPCISGNGKQYGEFLNGLMNICKENQLNKSANILAKIIERSEHEFYGFFSL